VLTALKNHPAHPLTLGCRLQHAAELHCILPFMVATTLVLMLRCCRGRLLVLPIHSTACGWRASVNLCVF
jgi:hypothetical protein